MILAQQNAGSATLDVAYYILLVALMLAFSARSIQSLRRGDLVLAPSGGAGIETPRERHDPVLVWLAFLIYAVSIAHGLSTSVLTRVREGASPFQPIDALAIVALAGGFAACVALQVYLRRRGGFWPQDAKTKLVLTLPALPIAASAIVWVVLT